MQQTSKVHRMKLRTRLLSTVAAIGLSAVALPAAAVDFLFNLTDVGTFGAPTYGTVSLLQDGTSVDFKITLDPEFNFVSTGGHHVFSFNGTGVAAGDITGITDSTGQSFTVDSPNAVNPPFGTFQFGIAALPLQHGLRAATTIRIASRSRTPPSADFLVLSTNAGNLGPRIRRRRHLERRHPGFGATARSASP
jgi:hypothetical protein